MGSFGSKLSRAAAHGAGRLVPPAPPVETRVELDPEEAAARAKTAAKTPEDEPAPTLDALRARIAGILGKTAPVRPPPRHDPTAGELPFACEETPLGPLYVRTRRLSPAHRVGRAAVRAGAVASSPMLALLALDPRLHGCDPARALYVDTETTGLAGGTGTVPFLIGLAWFEADSGALVVEQLLLRRLGEEAPILERLSTRVRAASMLVSFNGKAFDLPLLRTRCVMNRVAPLDEPPHLDLVHVARRVHRGRLSSFHLGAIEAHVLGFARENDIPSGEVVSRYAHFLRTGDDSALLAVVMHNDWDVVAMAALVGLYGEPIDALSPRDLAGVARTLRRARALDLAGEIAEVAVSRGGGAEAVRARGEIAKARGDRARALVDFASLLGSVDDPSLRLELAKLYEHHARAPLAALEVALAGTGEGEAAHARRLARLAKKAERAG